MSVCFLVAATFSNNSFASITSSRVRNPYLPDFPDDKVPILAVCLFQLY